MATRNVCFLVLMTCVLEQIAEVIAQERLGCYRYSGIHSGIRKHSIVTLPWCQTLCSTTTYFTLWRGGTGNVSCSCSGSLPTKIGDIECDSTCNGLKCGGMNSNSWRSLYTTCPRGRYGSDPLCGNECHCKDSAVCPITDGHCSNGCQPNWTGTSCNVCGINWQGANCDVCHISWQGANCDVCAQNWEGTNCERCITGWQGSDCLQDVDECLSSPCEHMCNDTEGSFLCSCPEGFQLAEDGRHCTDIDECAANLCVPHSCVDGVNDYTCKCNAGFRLEQGDKNCIDVDECQSSPCEHMCYNTEGSSLCSCPEGFNLAEDGRHCTDFDDCEANPCGSHSCIDGVNNYTCECNAGFRPEQGDKSCIDCHFVEYTTPDVGVKSGCKNLQILEELPLPDCFSQACRHGADVINYYTGRDLCDLRLCDRQASGGYMLTPVKTGWAVYVLDGPEAQMEGRSPSWVPTVAGVLVAVVVIAAAVAGLIYWWRRKNARRPTSGADVIHSANQSGKIATDPSQQAVSNGEEPDKTYEEISQQTSGRQLEDPTSTGPRVSASYETIGPSVEFNNPYDNFHIYSS